MQSDNQENKAQEETHVSKRRWWHWPSSGKFLMCFNLFMFVNNMIQAFIVIARAAFEDKPKWYSLYLENYMNIVFFLAMIKQFTNPRIDLDKQTVKFTFCSIIFEYFKGWFLIDLFCFIPIAHLRAASNWENGSPTDNWQNLIDLNFERLPKIYILILVP